MRVVLLNNPSSGSGSGPSGDELAAMLRQEGAAGVAIAPVEAAADAVGPGAGLVVLAGDDRGVGPAADAAGAAGVPLAVIPGGTADDFARRMGLPGDPRQAARLAVRGEHRRRLDLAWMGDRPFANVATAVVGRPLRCTVDVDGRRVFQGGAWQVMVACSGAFGAGSVVDEAEPDDGLLDVVVIQAGNRLRLIQYATALREGRITGQPGVLGTRGARVSLGLPAGAEMNVDGEILPAQAPIAIAAGHFELVVP